MTKDEINKRSNFHKHKPVSGPRTHDNCKAQTGVQRPGKTAQDRARRGIK